MNLRLLLTSALVLLAAAGTFVGVTAALGGSVLSDDNDSGGGGVAVRYQGVEALPAFDPTELVLGGSGAAGATLLGPGIVPSVYNTTPYTLQIPTARLDADVVWLTLAPDTALGAPDNPDVIGWWVDGPRPGETGNVLMDCHVDYTDIAGNVGTGVCWSLRDVRAGDPILVQHFAAQETYVYTVRESTLVGAADPAALRYIQPAAAPVLTLVTCEGSFDRAAFEYSDRRIVVADLTAIVRFADQPAPPVRRGT